MLSDFDNKICITIPPKVVSYRGKRIPSSSASVTYLDIAMVRGWLFCFLPYIKKELEKTEEGEDIYRVLSQTFLGGTRYIELLDYNKLGDERRSKEFAGLIISRKNEAELMLVLELMKIYPTKDEEERERMESDQGISRQDIEELNIRFKETEDKLDKLQALNNKLSVRNKKINSDIFKAENLGFIAKIRKGEWIEKFKADVRTGIAKENKKLADDPIFNEVLHNSLMQLRKNFVCEKE